MLMSNSQHKWVWLDDVRPAPNATWHWVKDYDEFVKLTKTSMRPHTASLDHDLADVHYQAYHLRLRGFVQQAKEVEAREKCGLDVVRFMIETEWLPPRVIIHSLNPAGVRNMVALLKDAGYRQSGYADVRGACANSPVLLR